MVRKLLVLTPTMEPNTGWGRYSSGVLSEFQERNEFEITIWTDLGDPMSFKYTKNPKHIVKLAESSLRLKKKIAQIDPDAVLSLIAHPYVAATYLATIGGRKTPYFVCCHGTYSVSPLHRKIDRQLSLRAFKNAEQIFPVSSFTAKKMQEAVPDLANITVAKNGLRRDSFPEARAFDLSHLTVLTVGPFKPRKGQKLGIEAFAQISSQFSDVEYHLVGEIGGEYYESVQNTVNDLGISDKVHFEGFVSEEELQRWYETADIYLFPAQYMQNHHFEGFGLVILEANLYGTPAIGTTCSGAIDAISDGVSGLLTPPENKNISNKLYQLLSDGELRNKLSTNAINWARQHTWEKTTNIICEEI